VKNPIIGVEEEEEEKKCFDSFSLLYLDLVDQQQRRCNPRLYKPAEASTHRAFRVLKEGRGLRR